MVRVITISREYGSGGAAVAQILSARLGWRLVDEALRVRIAQSANASPDAVRTHEERCDSSFHRLVKALWRGGYTGSVARVESEACDADTVARLSSLLIQEAAEIGQCVVVGRGGQCILQRRPDAFHVHIYAPMRDRIKRLEMREPAGADLAAAARASDLLRAEYVRHYFEQDWKNVHLYHMMLCSSIGLEPAADAIICAAGLRE
jgi:cytidylate kinase